MLFAEAPSDRRGGMGAGYDASWAWGYAMTVPVSIQAGEPSGDQLAARIMDAAEAFGSQTWFGVGGPQTRTGLQASLRW